MATPSYLFLSILALDSYSHGYNPGMKVASNIIGTATISEDADTAPARAVGFYAVAYDWAGSKVISYRGTTFELGLNTLNDVFHGWTLGIGYSDASQPQMAMQRRRLG